jgi:hypothetical protein
MGSGVVLRKDQKELGIENFEKSILKFFNSEEDMYIEEGIIVDRVFTKREDVYNLVVGGNHVLDEVRRLGGRISGKINGRKAVENKTGIFSEEGWNIRSKNGKTKENLERLEIYRERLKSEESICKRKNTFKNIKHQQGEKNSQYGKMWITNEKDSYRIDRNASIPEGWRKGRVINKD